MKARTLLWAALPALSLASCGQTRVERISPPAERLVCAAEPVPTGDTDKDVAQFIVDALAAGQSCRDALAWVHDWALSLDKVE